MCEPFSFAELAVELRLAANREAGGVAELELWNARDPNAVVAESIALVRRTADALAEAHYLIKGLIGREDEVRSLLARLAASLPPPPRFELGRAALL